MKVSTQRKKRIKPTREQIRRAVATSTAIETRQPIAVHESKLKIHAKHSRKVHLAKD